MDLNWLDNLITRIASQRETSCSAVQFHGASKCLLSTLGHTISKEPKILCLIQANQMILSNNMFITYQLHQEL